MDHINVWEIVVAIATLVNLWHNMTIKNAVLSLKLEITEKFVSKEDFRKLREYEK
jgi:hypothetical protein